MTPEQLSLVKRTAAVVAGAGEEFSRHFYDRLFDIRPGTRQLFGGDLGVPRGKLADEVILLAAAAADLPAFLDRARRLGQRHQSYGVHAADYPAVGQAVVDAAAHVVGDAWSEDAAEAWRRLCAMIADAMLEGAAGGLFSERR